MQNIYRIDGDRTFIDCVSGNGTFMIDTEDLERVSRFPRWAVDKYSEGNVLCYEVSLRRMLLGLNKGDPHAYHLNLNKLDYRKRNLATGELKFVREYSGQIKKAYLHNDAITKRKLEESLLFHESEAERIREVLQEHRYRMIK
jgi:hypothetical protein